jgi:hypothetical protein
LSLAANQALANYGDVNATATTEKNLQKSQQFNANVRYGLAASLGLEGGIDHNAVDFSLPNDQRTVRNDGANLGLRWGGGGALSLGLTGRVSRAKYPTILQVSPGVFESDKIDRHDIETSVTWIPTGASTLTGHVSFTRENHTLASQPNFRGVTGGVQWDYHLTGKVALTAALNRDTGTASTFLQLAQAPGIIPIIPLLPTPTETIRVDSNRLSNTAILTANYELTAKIRLNADARRTSSSSGGASRETLGTYAFGAKYDPTRTITLGCNASRETRAGFYKANVVGCDAQITFR